MKKQGSKNRAYKISLTVLINVVVILICSLTFFIAQSILKDEDTQKVSQKAETVEKSSVEIPSEPEFVNTYATVISTGDIMVHEPQLTGAYVPSSGEYDFSDIFVETKSYFKKADLAIANLEVTFGGNEGRNYSGYPAFNCPDSLADSIKKSGLNLLLTANNHSYDTGFSGLLRTQQVLRDKGIEYTGTVTDGSEENFVVKEINNIKIGIADFTYETDGNLKGRKYLNGIILSEEANNLINSFSYQRLGEFYNNAQNIIDKMKEQGAEYIVFYIHWGNEYKIYANDWQKTIAQQLSNRGVDMIIGGHPHVIEPVELIHSEDGQNTTVCLYSLGNAVSNQRQERMDSCPSGHTEDGMLFSFTLIKTKDGVSLDNLDIIPTWVDKFRKGNGYRYTIYPLENENDGAEKYSLTGSALIKSVNSYKRTIQIIAEGLTECQKYVGCEVTFNETFKEE